MSKGGSMRMQRLSLLCVLVASGAIVTLSNNSDRFNYRATDTSKGYNDYGPEDWNEVTCSDIDTCLGWPDKWKTGQGWSLRSNTCEWCPDSGNSCGTHHQSPINLKRDWYDLCTDDHWSAFHDSSCTWNDLVANNAFTIERHALKVTQPISGPSDSLVLNCSGPTFGRIDFSNGFPTWWFLSHMDFHVPSEHTQNGKQYSAEVHMYHFYSTTDAKQAAAVTILLEAYDSSPPLGFLDKLICQWRRSEDARRQECGMSSITTDYPGCFPYQPASTTQRDLNTDGKQKPRNLRHDKSSSQPQSAWDVIFSSSSNKESEANPIKMDPANFRPPDEVDWDELYRQHADVNVQSHRELINYDNVGPWHNYFLLIAVQTEYYYRYQGALTFPPCFGPYIPSTGRGAVHYRVMKDPVRVNPRQIAEMERLLAQRIAPPDDPNYSCQPDTAGKIVDSNPNRVSVARPLQSLSKGHLQMFCQCDNWQSKRPEDRAWCELDVQERLFNQPYNFKTQGF